jgi:hypothetical protein
MITSCDVPTSNTTYREEYVSNQQPRDQTIKVVPRVLPKNQRIWDIYSPPVAELQVLLVD